MTAMSAVLNAEPATAELAPTALAGIPASRAPRPLRRDASRTRSEARLVFRAPLVGDEDDGWDGRRFSVLEVTSGLPEDSRASDEHERARVEAQRRGRVAAAKAALEAHPEAREQVYRDQTRLRSFCARFSITPADICPNRDEASPVGTRCGWCRGLHNGFHPVRVEDATEVLRSPCDHLAEVRAREAACLPGSDRWG